MTPVTDLIEEVYEAAAVPELWPAVLDKIAGRIGAAGAVMFAVNAQHGGRLASGLAARYYADQATDASAPADPRPQRAIAANRAGLFVDHDLFTAEEIEQHPHYVRLRSRGLGWCIATLIEAPRRDFLIVSFERAFKDGPYGAATVATLDPLRPHLARAAAISGRLGLERAQAAAATLGLIGLPAAVLSRSHRIVAANALMEKLIPRVVQDRPSRIGLVDRRADAQLGQSLLQLDHHASEPVRSIPVAATARTPAAIAHIVPVRGTGRDIFVTGESMLVMTAVAHHEIASAKVIEGLFDLTPAEARIARRIGGGWTVEETAVDLGRSPGTVRQHLKSVFGKIGVSRQAELVGLLAGSALSS